MRALERTLPADTQVKMRSGTEDDMRQFRDTAGVKIRNEWVTGDRTPLAAWFRTQHGLDDPDEASGIVLVSFWRYLHGRPARVEDQVREARNRSAQRLKKAEAERLRMLDAGTAISGSRLGWQVRQARVPALTLPQARHRQAQRSRSLSDALQRRLSRHRQAVRRRGRRPAGAA